MNEVYEVYGVKKLPYFAYSIIIITTLWMFSKVKGDALTCGSYRGIKQLEHAMKVLERVIEGRLRKIVRIDSMQFEFMAGKSTTGTIFSPSAAGEIFGKE